MRYFQTAIARFLPVAYVGHVNLAAAKQWRVIPKLKDGSTVEFIIFRVQDFLSAYVGLPCQILLLYYKVVQWDIM